MHLLRAVAAYTPLVSDTAVEELKIANIELVLMKEPHAFSIETEQMSVLLKK